MTPGEWIAAGSLGLVVLTAVVKITRTLGAVQAAGEATRLLATEALRKAQSAHMRIDHEHREQQAIVGDVRVLASVVSERTGRPVDPLRSTGRFKAPIGEEPARP